MQFPSDWDATTIRAVLNMLKGDGTGSYNYSFYATLLTLEDEHVMRLPPLIPGAGSKIQHDNPGIQCDVIVGDPDRTLRGYEGPNARKFLIRIFCEAHDPEVQIEPFPIGTFAVQTVQRQDWQVTFHGVSKVLLAQYRPLEPFTVKAGKKITDAIRAIMVEAGEADKFIHLPDLAKLLKHDETVAPAAPDDDPDTAPRTFMVIARQLADQLGLDLFYRIDGTLLGRKSTKKAVYKFDHTWYTADGAPQSTSDFDGFHNVIVLLWGKDLKEKPVVVRPPAKHKLSPESLARRGKEFVQALVIEMPHERKRENVEQHGHQVLRGELQDALTEKATIFPFPFLESGDYVSFGGSTVQPSWTLWLDIGKGMDIGWTQFAFLGPL